MRSRVSGLGVCVSGVQAPVPDALSRLRLAWESAAPLCQKKQTRLLAVYAVGAAPGGPAATGVLHTRRPELLLGVRIRVSWRTAHAMHGLLLA